jgi:alpha-galactosidase
MFPRTRMPALLAAALCFLILTANASVPDVEAWVDAAFDGAAPRPAPKVPSLTLRRQDYGHLEINHSVMGAPIRIGQRQWDRGLGTHANSEILVTFPPGTAKEFEAKAGVDSETGNQGSVEFMIEIGGTNVYRSRTLHGGEEALPVHVRIPPGASQIVLKVDTTPDGPAFDHADWAEARLNMADASAVWLDELAAQSQGEFWPGEQMPFSFTYGGISSEKFLLGWKRRAKSHRLPQRIIREIHWSDPQTALQVSATVTVFDDFPAADWYLRFENDGAGDTPILENVQALDVILNRSPEHDLTLDQINGDDASERSFVPTERALAAGQSVALAPVGGRPSSGTFPMFNLQEYGRGFFTAIGWTGQWAASLRRNKDGQTRLKAGMELTHLVLHPGETIRTPRILLMPWSGDRTDAHNQFRRLLLAHYMPRLDGHLPDLAVAAQSFNEGPPGWATEGGQLACVDINRDLGCDTLWMDAGWFKGDFPNGAGNWIPKAKEFPDGLAPIGEACEKAGLKFLVWFEPERVCANSQIALEHPGFVLPVNKKPGAGGLFNLGDPAARRWLTDLLVREIAEFHISTYRNDFNMDPLPYWRQNDTPDRQGITEIRYVEGLYAMWDELRAKFPHMYIDDCASGGRRIDLELISRSVVQTQSDAAGAPGRGDWDQSQNYGLSLFLPFHATIGWEVGAYECRSAATQGFCAEWNILDKNFPRDLARACISEINANRQYWSGDFYPLTPWTMSSSLWMAWQAHRPDMDEGLILAFRHQDSPYAALEVNLHGIKPEKTYGVEFVDEQHRVTKEKMSGQKLSTLELKIPGRRQSLLVRYALEGN